MTDPANDNKPRDFRLMQGDCIEVLRSLPDASVDAIVTDPPYGLEFMGKEWDKFRAEDDPTTARWRGDRAGNAGTIKISGSGALGDSATPAYGGKRPVTSRCTGCGKRDAFRNEYECVDGAEWERELVNPNTAPPSMVAFQNWTRLWALEAYRVLKPGGHLLAFSGSRTYHRTAAGIEDAGFEIRDQIMWVYGSGFPKSLDVSKAIDKAEGVEREVVGVKADPRYASAANGATANPMGNLVGHAAPDAWERAGQVTAPATDAARAWQGWGTALKPAHEPIVVARKPLSGTVAETVLEHGTGALNIDGCRVGGEPVRQNTAGGIGYHGGNPIEAGTGTAMQSNGRWPANLIHDGSDEVVALFPDADSTMTGRLPPGAVVPNPGRCEPGIFGVGGGVGNVYSDSGSAARFFYCAKASRAEREAGLEDFALVRSADRELADGPGGDNPRNRSNRSNRNHHPTVKPIDLMRYLCRLVTPPGGTVLDPFTGSGTTGIGAVLEGFRFIGIEREAEYVAIAQRRIAHWEHVPDPDAPPRRAAVNDNQPDLFGAAADATTADTGAG